MLSKVNENDEPLKLLVDYILDSTVMFLLESDSPPNWNLNNEYFSSDEITRLKYQMLKQVDLLPAKLTCILKYHYFHQVNFTDIGKLLGISKNRVSQCHSEAIKRLKKHLS